MTRTRSTLVPKKRQQQCSLLVSRSLVGIVLLLMCFVEGFVVPRTVLSVPHRQRPLSPSTKLSVLPEGLLAAGSETAASVASTAARAAAAATPEKSPLMKFFLETLISNAVPAFFAVVVISFAAAMIYGKDDDEDGKLLSLSSKVPAAALYDDLYGDQDQDFGGSSSKSRRWRRLFGAGNKKEQELPKNTGVPADQYIKITNLNRKLDSYQYSVTAATESKAQAAADYRQKAFSRAFGKAVISLDPHTLQKLSLLEQDFLKKGSKLLLLLQKLQMKLTEEVVDDELHAMGLKNVYELDPNTNVTEANSHNDAKPNAVAVAAAASNNNSTSLSLENIMGKGALAQEVSKTQRTLQLLELKFIKDVVQAVGPAHAASVRTALLGNIAVRGLGGLLVDLRDRPLSYIVNDDNGGAGEDKGQHRPPSLYVTHFPGDGTASQVSDLRQEVTAIVRNARAGVDEALVVLQTGGGTVTGYGLAAAQLLRLKEAGLKLTIAVEQVAASGGYMMACIADHIVASPFAVLGSIGVITDIPNFYERLKQEGIEFQTVTAGKYKRTLTPTKKVTREDFLKTKEDVEDIYRLFRDFVAQNRPQLDIESVATGETWFGQDALDRNLCDEIKTVDDVLMNYVDKDYNVYEVKYKAPEEKSPLSALVPVGADGSSGNEGLVARGIQWLVRTIASQVRAELGTNLKEEKPLQERYMAKDDTADRVRAEG